MKGLPVIPLGQKQIGFPLSISHKAWTPQGFGWQGLDGAGKIDEQKLEFKDTLLFLERLLFILYGLTELQQCNSEIVKAQYANFQGSKFL